jgi:predicted DNA-binding transcriptional regulator YafY
VPYVATHPEGVPLTELARLLGLTTVQARREIEALLMVGVPGGSPADFFDIGIEGRASSARVVATPSRLLRRPPRLTRLEAHALLLGAAALGRTGLAPFDDALGRASRKIRALVSDAPEGSRRTNGRAAPAAVLQAPGPPRGEVFAPLAHATRARRVVELDYASLAGQKRKKVVMEPYGLLNHRGSWYVLGRSRTHAEDRVFVFKVERIRAVIVLEDAFTVPPDFDLRRYKQERLFIAGLAPVDVKLRLRGDAARRLGPTLRHSKVERGGAIVARFRECPTGWLASWVLRQGPGAEVVAPPRLAAWVRELATRVADAHAPDALPAPARQRSP